MARFGGQAANFTADDLKQSPGEDEEDLEDLMARNKISDNHPTSKAEAENTASEAELEKEAAEAEKKSSFYKTQQSVSNYDISAALYGKAEAKATTNFVAASEVIDDIGKAGGECMNEYLFT